MQITSFEQHVLYYIVVGRFVIMHIHVGLIIISDNVCSPYVRLSAYLKSSSLVSFLSLSFFFYSCRGARSRHEKWMRTKALSVWARCTVYTHLWCISSNVWQPLWLFKLILLIYDFIDVPILFTLHTVNIIVYFWLGAGCNKMQAAHLEMSTPWE